MKTRDCHDLAHPAEVGCEREPAPVRTQGLDAGPPCPERPREVVQTPGHSAPSTPAVVPWPASPPRTPSGPDQPCPPPASGGRGGQGSGKATSQKIPDG